MRDFSWNVFLKTGDVDAYLLYKQFEDREPLMEEEADDEQGEAADPLM